MNTFTNIVTVIVIVLLSLNLFKQATKPEIWIEAVQDRIAVKGKTSNGKIFTIMIFDRSFLDNGIEVIGVDMSTKPTSPQPSARMLTDNDKPN